MLKDELQLHQDWIEFDLNPLITFNNSGKILYTNNEAQFFLNQASQKQLFDLALQYAPKNYGICTNFVDLSFGNYTFYAVCVGYYDDENITIKFYKSTGAKKENLFKTKGEIVNIFTLVDVIISTNAIKSKTKFIKNYDPSIPEFRVSAKDFLKLLNSVVLLFENISVIDVIVKLKVGEYVKISNKKHQILSVEFHCKCDLPRTENNIEALSSACGSIAEINKNNVKINLPIVTD